MGGAKKETQKTAQNCEKSLICHTEDTNAPEVPVSLFEFSVENHFKAMDTISRLCEEEAEANAIRESEIERLSSTILFLREWRHYNYKPRTINFASETESSLGRDVVDGINLHQFSAASVPKERFSGATTSSESRKDFVLYVGGCVWALDWCPKVNQRSGCHNSCEFIAVSAHPPESSYHKIGAPLSGRGIVQIWCLLNNSMDEDMPPPVGKPKGRPRKNDSAKNKASTPQRQRGRPRKKPIIESLDVLDCENQFAQSLGQFPEISSELVTSNGLPMNSHEHAVQEAANKQEKGFNRGMAACNTAVKTSARRPRGRPRKRPIIESLDGLDCENQLLQPLAVQFPENSCKSFAIDGLSTSSHEYSVQECANKQEKGFNQVMAACNSAPKTPTERRRSKRKTRVVNYCDESSLPLSTQNKNKESSPANFQTHINSEEHPMMSSDDMPQNSSFGISSANDSIPNDVALPRIVLCLAHNGKVAWDVKWRPSSMSDLECKHRMGYLAVLLGNGSLEVWEVPSLHTIKVIYSSSKKEGTDPRFIKLKPVFRCSNLKYGDRQSIPLTVEWSAFSPHDLIVAGCHDGTVALWKFSANGSFEGSGTMQVTSDTRPLLCFSADTVPIRALAWAPVETDPESANIIVTAGHAGVKFWDIRDPFRPLWEINPVRRVIYSVDWLPDPRCIILSFDDGTLRIFSLAKIANDVPVTGKPFSGTQQPGLICYSCSPFPIWSVQVSRATGLAAYCSADGTVRQFQLTIKAVEKDSRNKAPHFLCGSLTEEDSVLTINTPLSTIPFVVKKALNQWGDTPRSIRGISESNQAKRVNNQKSNDQPLDLCEDNDDDDDDDDNDSSIEVSGSTKAASKRKQKTKSKSSSKKNPKKDQAALCSYEEAENLENKEDRKEEGGNEIEVFPSKIVALHRVRWNMNKGSEGWLCYGGAAGIVRCQKITAGVLKKDLVKR